MSRPSRTRKTTLTRIAKLKRSGEPITMVTAYDYTMAHLVDAAGIDTILVGDSVSNVMHGHATTLPISMDLMVAHTAAVARAVERAFLIADMPFGSYQSSHATAVENATRFLKEGHAEAVKLEGGIEMVERVKAIVASGIPVVGHVGLTPQSIHRFGGHRVQGRTKVSTTYLKESALALEEAGCPMIVLELVERSVAAEITAALTQSATIGIGAGTDCDGQVLVINDLLGFSPNDESFTFVRKYADLRATIIEAVASYADDVKRRSFPSDDESFGPK